MTRPQTPPGMLRIASFPLVCWSLAVVSVLSASVIATSTTPATAGENASAGPPAGAESGLTDLTLGSSDEIQAGDIIEALAISRGTRVRAARPPAVRLPVYFAIGSADLRDDARRVLDRVGQALSADELKSYAFLVEGHTDDSGAPSNNAALSESRAQSVRAYLMRLGVAADRLKTAGRGDRHPVASNGTSDGRRRNRRVEIVNTGLF